MNLAITAAERGWLPDWVVRFGIRSLLRQRLRQQLAEVPETGDVCARHLTAMRAGPIALVPDAANAQHYEVPAAFFQHVLGPRLKYSCGWWPTTC